MHGAPDDGGVRIAELVATLSYAADLGLGQPMQHCMRQTVIALRMADLVGASAAEREATYYLGLMMNVYCHADAAEQARWFGDDISFKGAVFDVLDMSTAGMIAFLVRRLGSHGSGMARARRLAAFPMSGQKEMLAFLNTHSTLGSQFAERIGLGDTVRDAVRQAYEQWDGKGQPGQLQGVEVCLPARLVQLASPVEVFSRRRGVDAARSVARRHRGTQFDPAVVDLFCAHALELLAGLDEAADWDAVLDAEPELSRRVAGDELDAVLEAMADLVDLKSPYLAGHSRGVANLAGEAARLSGMGEDDVRAAARRLGARSWPAGGLQLDLGQADRAWRGRRRAGSAASLSDRPHARPGDGAWPQPGDRVPPPRAAGRLGLPARVDRRLPDAVGSASRRRGRLPRDDRTPPVPAATGCRAGLPRTERGGAGGHT